MSFWRHLVLTHTHTHTHTSVLLYMQREALNTTPLPKKFRCCVKHKYSQIADIFKWTVFSDNSFTKCSWAHAVMSFIHSCVWQSDEPGPVLACEQQGFWGCPSHTQSLYYQPLTKEPVYSWNIPKWCFWNISPIFCCPCPNMSETHCWH